MYLGNMSEVIIIVTVFSQALPDLSLIIGDGGGTDFVYPTLVTLNSASNMGPLASMLKTLNY